MKYAFFLGRNEELSLAELSALLGENKKILKTGGVAIFEGELLQAQTKNPQTFLNRLGGTTEIAGIFAEHIPLASVELEMEKFLLKKCAGQTGKCSFAANLFPENKKSRVLKTVLPAIKKYLRGCKISANFMNNNFQNASPVLVLKQRLHERGTNIWIIEEGEGRASLASTCAIQDIDAYSLRDYHKPFRDAQAGMLPPKLAQIMVNLAVSNSDVSRHGHDTLIYDPFCGTGTILMEALLMGFSVAGSDSDARMVEGARKNVDWLRQRFQTHVHVNTKTSIFHKNAMEPAAQQLLSIKAECTDHIGHTTAHEPRLAIATEPCLGPPLSNFPASAYLEKVIAELADLYLRFFKSLASWLPGGTSIVFIFPYWKKSPREAVYLSAGLIEKIKPLGYSVAAFDPSQKSSCFYDRPDSVVGREIIRFTKNGAA